MGRFILCVIDPGASAADGDTWQLAIASFRAAGVGAHVRRPDTTEPSAQSSRLVTSLPTPPPLLGTFSELVSAVMGLHGVVQSRLLAAEWWSPSVAKSCGRKRAFSASAVGSRPPIRQPDWCVPESAEEVDHASARNRWPAGGCARHWRRSSRTRISFFGKRSPRALPHGGRSMLRAVGPGGRPVWRSVEVRMAMGRSGRLSGCVRMGFGIGEVPAPPASAPPAPLSLPARMLSLRISIHHTCGVVPLLANRGVRQSSPGGAQV